MWQLAFCMTHVELNPNEAYKTEIGGCGRTWVGRGEILSAMLASGTPTSRLFTVVNKYMSSIIFAEDAWTTARRHADIDTGSAQKVKSKAAISRPKEGGERCSRRARMDGSHCQYTRSTEERPNYRYLTTDLHTASLP